ncbi:hypothetical protein DYB37_001033 [Aphanomyces astaci]|uniref:Protein kinase domain-containing protein n=1 Tax=Aphanomyces astaci TaxID=112090 RepID=A0A418EPE0_APHAT|nr:hypothetical protein DYB37_001033 [Aphanomyces astaci]
MGNKKKQNQRKKAAATGECGRPAASASPAEHALPISEATLDACKAMQDEEMEVLQAIYGDDYSERKSIKGFPSFAISISKQGETLSSNGSGDIQGVATVSLRLQLRRGYPVADVPDVDVESSDGLTDSEVATLEEMLQDLSREKLKLGEGAVMVHDLIVATEEFLLRHIKDQRSFFDQMVKRHQKQAERDAEEHRRTKALEQEQAMHEEQQMQKVIQADIEKKAKMKHRGGQQHHHHHHQPPTATAVDHATSVRTTAAGRYDSSDESSSGSSDGSFGDSDSDSRVVPAQHSTSRYWNDFKEDKVLGRGGGGEVLKVQNRLDRQWYAVKRIKLDSNDPTMKKKILREANVHHHHNGGGPVAGGPRKPKKTTNEKLFIQMEYCGGNTLRDVIDQLSLWKSEDKVWTLFRQILEAIAYIHSEGVIHRDIKVTSRDLYYFILSI